ncbi:uncharacterized protein LOC124809281 isoform X2 [Hydra vulgaris]|uniref:uncharacterized protein LOC124809281 isoform X3 n=1 Tax=Hydra vulgaris TaxID=6087 RepID=UPI001F5F6932|nr:uncharacterized protein LOC124809281 isoform X2 [Hydra vulgaris]
MSVVILKPSECWKEKVQESQSITKDTLLSRTNVSNEGSNILQVTTPTTPSSEASNRDITGINENTPTSSASGILSNQMSLESFLLQHTKTKHHMIKSKTGTYGISERQAITYVTAAKVIDCYGNYPPKDKMKMVSIFLTGITGLKPEDFFEPKSHKGFLAKCIENPRAKLSSNEKRWTWTPKEERDKARQTLQQSTAPLSDALSRNSLITTVLQNDEFIFTGCCRELEECEFCEGITGDDLKIEMIKLATLSASVFGEDLLLSAKKTFCYRRKKIEECHPSYLECVHQIPCYLSMPQMLLQDFRRMYPDAADRFVVCMENLISSVLLYCSKSTVEYLQKCNTEGMIGGSNGKTIAAMKSLLYLLPMTGKKRLTAKESFDLLIAYGTPGTGNSIDVPQNLAHPKLYLEYSLNDEDKITGRIVCDGKVCLAGCSMVECLDYMFKLFWIFNLEYPSA